MRLPIIALPFLALAIGVSACGRSDASIQDDVRSRLVVDDVTNGMDVSVRAEGGVVHLSGQTRLRRQHDRALEIAGAVAGTDKVRDEIRINEHPFAAAVREAIARDPLVASVPLEIDASDAGIVTLKSVRTNKAQRARLVEIARAVPGVTKVEDQMQ